MKIKDIINEKNRSTDSKIAASSKEAETMHDNAQQSKAGEEFDVRAALAKVRGQYDVGLVDDFADIFDPNRKSLTDKEKSLLSTSPRDKFNKEEQED